MQQGGGATIGGSATTTTAADPVLPSLRNLVIQSTDTLRHHEILSLDIGSGNNHGWRETPPLLIGPRGKPESDVLLKGLIRKGIPPALRCAVWLSNVIQAVHPHEDPATWHAYRTLEKVRSLDYAYEQLLLPLVRNEMEQQQQQPPNASSSVGEAAVWAARARPTYGQTAAATPLRGVTPQGLLAWKRVLIALQHVLGIDCAPLIPTLAALLLTCMSESYAFTAIREMAHAGASWYFATSRREHVAHCRCFGVILRKLHPHTAEYLEDRGVLDDASLDKIFQDMFVGVLPIHLVQRILDVYTLEGYKVLYRIGISLFVLYKMEAAQNLVTISNADEWWSHLQAWASHRLFNINVVMRKAYGVHGRMLRTQMRFPGRPLLARIIRVEEQLLAEEGLEDEADNQDASPLGLVESHETIGTTGHVQEVVKRVLVQDISTRQLLANWLPLTLRLTNLDLLYSTNYHGRSLEMFYARVKRAKNTILLAEVYSDNAAAAAVPPAAGGQTTTPTTTTVIGMYAPQPWHPSNQVYGDGSCFLFRTSPNPQCWKWTPTTEEAKNMDNLGEVALLNQFMVSRDTFISMGGNRDGSSGLRINEDLTIGESSLAAGFGNEPLHGVGKGSVFNLGLVEVYGLNRQIDGRPI